MADPLGVSVAFASDPFDTTPTWTRLDTLTGARVQRWTVDRGRPNEFAKTDTGTAIVELVDREGLFDPTNVSSPYVGQMVPGKQAAIMLQNPVGDSWHGLFRGFVESWTYELDLTRQYMTVRLALVDGFGFLSGMELQPGHAGEATLPADVDDGNVYYAATLTGTVADRMNQILDDVDWPNIDPDWRDIFSGNVKLREKVYSPGVSALAALWDAADGEFPGVANIWCDKETGAVVFRGRQPRFRPDVAEYGIQERDVGDPSATAGDPDVVPVAELGWTTGNDGLINQCLASPEGIADADIAAQVVRDATSIDTYGLRSLSFDNLQTLEGTYTGNNDLQETALFADYYVQNFSDPLPRINRMVFKTRRPGDTHGPALWTHMCRCEISDKLNVQTEHPGGGGFAASYYVEGIHYDGEPLNPDYHHVTLTLDVSPAARYVNNPFDADEDP